ncbi:rhoptry kinase family protein ROP37 (incomplete catalytic triad) [Besnoitia besnoiti]|uniref:Rhoptry kinase family protein ROP37 (Incomplete catalytic triad) n=1 Tax=Besnoitia besnoiti TaxID=94643 RepID=A0A2A9MQ89_BESBE|nr:rhoptry kinase family protein ROP37 (incomplete catalytic triad) [Besnoitia besnoiti]PFH38666.1 rhoptry kinase family protein ROP37 (incomplete catalytic triad) [Besnoitia besnoiti]
MNPITSEELRTGESDLREMVARVLSGQLEKEKTAWRMEVAGEYSATDTAPLPASRSERQKLREAAFRSAIPNGSLFNAYDTTGGAARLSVGRILGSGANGIVCRVQDTSVSSRAVDYAGKFFVRHLAPGSSQSIQDALSELTQSVEKETAANALLLERAALGDLLEHGIAVSHGLCTLISTHPQDTKLPSPWLSSPDEVSSKGRLVIGEKVLLMPLLGPALTKFWSKAMSDEALKYLVYTLVKTVSYLHGLGLAHRDVKLSNFVVDSRGKLFLIDYGFVTKMGDTAFCGKGAPPSYMDPHRAQCILNGEDEIVVSEHWDSWSLGVTIVKLLCDGEKPFRFEFPDRKLQDLVKNKTYLREFLQKFLKALERDKFVGDSCPFLTQERKKLLSIAMLLLDPQEGTRWTVRQLEQGHPFFLT